MLRIAMLAVFGLGCGLALDVPDRRSAPNLLCRDGTCACLAGFGDCDAEPGCETDINASSEHCGACAHDCLGGMCEAAICQPIVLAENVPLTNAAATHPYAGGVLYVSRDAVHLVRFDDGIVDEQLVLVDGVLSIVADENDIYLGLRRSVVRLTAGRELETVREAPPSVSIVDLAVTDGKLVWGEESMAPPHGVRQCTLPCTAASTTEVISSQARPTAVSVWDTRLIWQAVDRDEGVLLTEQNATANPIDSWNDAKSSVFVVPKIAPSLPGLLYARPRRSLMALRVLFPDASHMALVEEDVRDFALGEETIFVALPSSIVRISALDGTVTSELPGPRNAPAGMSADSRAVFWLDTRLEKGIVGTVYAVAVPR